MASVFISYRRTDSQESAKRIAAHLQHLLGKRNVFIDIDSIAGGELFPQRLQLALRRADVMLVVIGPHWATAADAAGHLRLADPTDFVRLEVVTALAGGKPVIPLYLDGVTLTPADVPPNIAPLLQRPTLALSAKALDGPDGLQAFREAQSQAIRSELRHMPPILYPTLCVLALLAALGGIGGLIAPYFPGLRVFDSTFSTVFGTALTISTLLAIVRTAQDRLWGWLSFVLALVIVPFFMGEAYRQLQPFKPVWVGAIIVTLLCLSLLGNRPASMLTLWRNARAVRKK